MNKAILSMTTIPPRLNVPFEHNTIRIVLESLKNLSYENYEIHLNIPFIYKKTGEEYTIPSWLQETEKINIFRTNDYGPVTKLVPTVNRISEPNTTIIILDDDLEYEDGFIEYHMENQIKYSNSAIGFAGLESRPEGICYYCTDIKEDIEVNILEGYKTVSFKKLFFKDDFESFILENMSWDDDMLISAYLAKENIRRIVISTGKDLDNTPKANSYPVKRLLNNELSGCDLERKNNVNNGREKMEKYFVQRPL